MKLEELKNVVKYEFDFMDDEVDGAFYIELESIKSVYAKQIEVVEIDKNYITCRFTDFIRNSRSEIEKYINETYLDGDTKNFLHEQLCKCENIIDDGGEAVYHFLQNDIAEFLTE